LLLVAARRLLHLAAAALLALPVLGQDQGKPKLGLNSIEVQLGFFDMDDSGDGNPFLDESLTVIEPVFIFDYQVTERLGTTTTFSYDHVSSASIDRLSKFPEQSGASGDNYYGLDVGFDYAKSELVTIGWHVGASVEYDYVSLGLGGSVSVDSEDRNSNWTFSLDAFQDSIDVIRFDGSTGPDDDRTSLSATINHYRVLTPTTHGEVGFTFASQSGFLETAYNAVVLEDPSLPPNPNLANNARGIETTEELPDDRMRGALFGRVRTQLAAGHAVELGGRIYSDSWGIDSIALEPRYYVSLGESVLRLRYRYYNQSEADDFGEQFLLANPLPEHHTQDSDLAAFDSNTIGARIDWRPNPSTRWSLSIDQIMRSDGLDHLVAAFGWKKDF
jgi:hypothetical protein